MAYGTKSIVERFLLKYSAGKKGKENFECIENHNSKARVNNEIIT